MSKYVLSRYQIEAIQDFLNQEVRTYYQIGTDILKFINKYVLIDRIKEDKILFFLIDSLSALLALEVVWEGDMPSIYLNSGNALLDDLDSHLTEKYEEFYCEDKND